MPPPVYFFGLKFWNESADDLLAEFDTKGGMLAVPSAPSLAQAVEDPFLLKAYQSAEWAVMDGGYVAMVVRLLGRNIRRISGHQLIQNLVVKKNSDAPVPIRERRILWVVPDPSEESRIRDFLQSLNFDTTLQSYYKAPYYQTDSSFRDENLIMHCLSWKPDWIILCLGGGRQEKLGYYLNAACAAMAQRPAILCTGAAISFFTGGQANIPKFVDRIYLGWFFRICQNPKTFLPRYVKAFWQFPRSIWRMREHLFTPPQ